jgi:hypothetical protein
LQYPFGARPLHESCGPDTGPPTPALSEAPLVLLFESLEQPMNAEVKIPAETKMATNVRMKAIKVRRDRPALSNVKRILV